MAHPKVDEVITSSGLGVRHCGFGPLLACGLEARQHVAQEAAARAAHQARKEYLQERSGWLPTGNRGQTPRHPTRHNHANLRPF